MYNIFYKYNRKIVKIKYVINFVFFWDELGNFLKLDYMYYLVIEICICNE